jgi:hypothetical protein
MTTELLKYGEYLIKNNNLTNHRKEFFISPNLENINNIEYLIDLALKNKILEEYNLHNFDKKIITKHYEINSLDSMKWHIDDCAIFRHKKDYEPCSNSIKLNHKYSIYFTNPPIYTIIIYLSSHNLDFTGGEFSFLDKVIIPQKFKVIFFDSREIHKVNKITSGIRSCILVKLYKKN